MLSAKGEYFGGIREVEALVISLSREKRIEGIEEVCGIRP